MTFCGMIFGKETGKLPVVPPRSFPLELPFCTISKVVWAWGLKPVNLGMTYRQTCKILTYIYISWVQKVVTIYYEIPSKIYEISMRFLWLTSYFTGSTRDSKPSKNFRNSRPRCPRFHVTISQHLGDGHFQPKRLVELNSSKRTIQIRP